jgi:NADH-quinone oxidoreductase subunit N
MTMLIPFLPDLALLALAFLVLAADLSGTPGRRAFHVAWMGLAAICLLIIGLPFAGAVPGSGSGAAQAAGISFAGYRTSPGILSWKLIFALAALGSVLLSPPYFRDRGNFRGTLAKPGAFLALIVLCAFGMFALVSARDMLVFYLGLELATLPLYALAAFQTRDADSVEAGSKLVLMGGFSSALTLFGLSLLFGVAGSVGFAALAEAVRLFPNEPLLWGGVFFLLGGLGFKLAMAPFHMWAPDVYQGSPTPVMAFLSVGSKAAAVAAMALLFFGPLDGLRPGLAGVFASVAVLSMAVGNLGAMRQRNLRRFVAYSSVAQAGYMLLALLGEAGAAMAALQYNLIVYGVSSFALYFVMGVVGEDGPENLSSLRGLGARSPGLAALLLLSMFSLAGIPPLAGFLGKFLLFSVAAAEGHYAWVGCAVAMAVVSFYYYMLVVKEAYMAGPEDGAMAGGAPIALGARRRLALWGLAMLLLLLGVVPVAADWLAARTGG